MESFGALTDRLLAVHCVCLKEEEEIAAFVRNGVNACYCPTSNAYLGSGIPPMASMLHQGVNITMGTDGAASNNSSDMIESLKIGLLLQKGRNQELWLCLHRICLILPLLTQLKRPIAVTWAH